MNDRKMAVSGVGGVRRWSDLAGALAGAGVLVALYLLSRSNYLLFHSIIEGFSIVVAFSVFIVAWNTRRWVANDYLLLLGISFLFVGGIDFFHTLTYAGMGVFPGSGPNPPTQLWILSRYVESISLLAAPLFLSRRVRLLPVFGLYALVATLGATSILYWKVFPDAFIEGLGLTVFKIASEYIICGILACALLFLYRQRAALERRAFRMLSAAIVVTIASELVFTLYSDVYGVSNMAGHLLKVVSFYLVYCAIIGTNLSSPYESLFRGIEESRVRAQHERDRAWGYLHITGSVIVVLDADGRVELINRRGCEVLGHPEAEILGKPWFESFLPSRLWRDTRVAFGSLMAGEAESDEYHENRVVTSSGEERLIAWRNAVLRDSDGAIVGTLGSGEDITERRRAEEAVRESEEKYRSLFDSSREAIVLTAPDGRLVDANPAFLELLDYAQDDLAGLRMPNLVVDGPDVNEFLARLHREGQILDDECRFRRKDGTVIDCIRTIVVWRNEAGEVVAHQGLIRDVTQSKRDHAELQRSREELRSLATHLQLVREEERSAVAEELHDEVGQALSALKMDIGYCRRQLPPRSLAALRPKIEAMMDLLDSTIERLRNLYSDLRPGMLDDLGLAATVEWRASELERRFGIKCRVVKADPVRLRDADCALALYRAFQGALDNVVRHSGATEFEVDLEQRGGYVTLRVSDNGRGITDEEMASPTALGLAEMRERVLSCGGKLIIRRGDGEGTIVEASAPGALPEDDGDAA